MTDLRPNTASITTVLGTLQVVVVNQVPGLYWVKDHTLKAFYLQDLEEASLAEPIELKPPFLVTWEAYQLIHQLQYLDFYHVSAFVFDPQEEREALLEKFSTINPN